MDEFFASSFQHHTEEFGCVYRHFRCKFRPHRTAGRSVEEREYHTTQHKSSPIIVEPKQGARCSHGKHGSNGPRWWSSSEGRGGCGTRYKNRRCCACPSRDWRLRQRLHWSHAPGTHHVVYPYSMHMAACGRSALFSHLAHGLRSCLRDCCRYYACTPSGSVNAFLLLSLGQLLLQKPSACCANVPGCAMAAKPAGSHRAVLTCIVHAHTPAAGSCGGAC